MNLNFLTYMFLSMMPLNFALIFNIALVCILKKIAQITSKL